MTIKSDRYNIFIRLKKNLIKDKELYLIISPVILFYIIFHYVPMYGVLIAFKDFKPIDGIIGSEWIGFENYQEFFGSLYFWRLMKNTILLSIYSLIWGFPVPILFAVLLNEINDGLFKRSVQTISYFPHFIALVVVVGMIATFTSPLDGIVNKFIVTLGFEPINFLSEPGWFRTIFVSSEVWQSFGWGSIIYLAAIAGINPQLYEAAAMDGAKRWAKIRHITIPGILPTIIILFILNMGKMMDIGFEKVLLLYQPSTYVTADVIGTYVFRKGIIQADYSYAAAIGLFENMINIVFLLVANQLSRKLSDTSLW